MSTIFTPWLAALMCGLSANPTPNPSMRLSDFFIYFFVALG